MDHNTNQQKKMSTPVIIALAVAGLAVIGGLVYLLQQQGVLGNNSEPENTSMEEQENPQAGGQEEQIDTTGLVVEDIEIGGGQEVKPGDLIRVDYTGTLEDGTEFDTSEGKQPIQFQLGVGMVIPGWDIGLEGMKEGGKRKLTIPPHLAYGETGQGPIPPNATLYFDVELVEIVEVKG